MAGTDVRGAPFSSSAALRAAFEDGLRQMLRHDLLGVFVLVLANASYQRCIFERLRTPLELAFTRWSERFDCADAAAIGAAVDDSAVFARLRARGFDSLEVTRWRRLGPWELQFNPLRALRPPRLSSAPGGPLHQAFDPDGFHFNKPFLRREIFWEGAVEGTPLRLLYNKFPFAELHGLLVPEPLANRAQFLDRGSHEMIWRLAQHLGQTLPGIGFGYNARGAYASVNHLHFQMFVRSAGRYPVEAADWTHNGGPEHYPLPVQRHTDPVTAWQTIADLHAAETRYNLLYRPGAVYVLPRASQGSYVHAEWTGGFAWSELAGAITVSGRADFERLRPADIEAELAKLTIAKGNAYI